MYTQFVRSGVPFNCPLGGGIIHKAVGGGHMIVG